MPKLHKLLNTSARRTVDRFELNMNFGNSPELSGDLSCYFKLPLLLIKAGKKDFANKVIGYIYTNFQRENGDFKTTSIKKSDKPEYIEYWSYMNGWIIRAANMLNSYSQETDKGYKYLTQFHRGDGRGFLTHNPESYDGVTDILTAAHHGLLHLEKNNTPIAISAANYLVSVLELQPDMNNIFYLKFDEEMQPITIYTDKESMFFSVNKKEEQLYFMIAYPCSFLAILYQTTNEKKFLDASIQYMDFALSCHESIYSSNFSHKIAWAASILYEITKEKKYLDAITKISNHFLNAQDEHGMWLQENGNNTSYDQSAEIALWFLEISNNLERAEKQIAIDKNKHNTTTTIIKYGIGALLAGAGLFAIYNEITSGCISQDLNEPSL